MWRFGPGLDLFNSSFVKQKTISISEMKNRDINQGAYFLDNVVPP